jgi:hypothetical protein
MGIEQNVTTYRQTLFFSLPVAAFIIAGAIGVASPWLLVLLPIPFLVAWIVQRGLNDPVVLQDDEDQKRFEPLLNKIDVESQYSKIEEPLNQTDREILMTRQCEGYRYPETYIRKLIANNQKIIYQGHITSKYVYDGEYLITIGKTTHFDIPAGNYQKLTLGDYVQIAVAFARISGFKKPTFVLFCEIIRLAEELEGGG